MTFQIELSRDELETLSGIMDWIEIDNQDRIPVEEQYDDTEFLDQLKKELALVGRFNKAIVPLLK